MMAIQEEQGFNVEQLSEAEHLSLNWAIAVVNGEGSKAWRQFAVTMKLFWSLHPNFSVTTLAEMRTMGLTALMQKGIVEATKDGAGDWIPRKVHTEKLVGGSIISGELQ